MLYSMMHNSVAVALLSVGLLVAGCGEPKITNSSSDTGFTDTGSADAGDGGGLSDAAGPDPEVQAYAFDTVEALCEKIFECCNPQERLDEMGIDAADAQECADRAEGFAFIFGFSQVNDSVEAGRVEVDTAMAEMCMESIRQTACSEFTEGASLASRATGCREVLEAQVAEGGACAIDDDCTTGYCSPFEGTCQPMAQEGDDCQQRRCAPGLFCDSFDAICMAQRQLDQACLEHEECASGYCDANAQGNKVCVDAPLRCTG